MKKYHGSRNQFSYIENEEFISPLEVVDKVSDDDFIDVINEIVSDRWLEKYNTDWLKKLRNEVNNQRTGFIPERKRKALVKSMRKVDNKGVVSYSKNVDIKSFSKELGNIKGSKVQLNMPGGSLTYTIGTGGAVVKSGAEFATMEDEE